MVLKMSLFEMSFYASVIILVIIVCRALLINKLTKKVFIALWGVVILRLLIPYSFPSIFSIYSLTEQNQYIKEKTESILNYGKSVQEQKKNVKNVTTGEDDKKPAVVGSNIGKDSFSLWKLIWLVGFIVCVSVFVIAYILCYKRFCTSIPVNNEVAKEWLKSHKTIRNISIRQSDLIKSPLSYGNFKPVILMPKTTNWEDLEKLSYILEHEFVHITRFDAFIKLFLIIAVCVHWFNPMVWIMYILLNRDIELACDEAVVRHFGEDSKAAYARVLIEMEEEKSGIIPFGSNFNGNAEEERIMAIMNIKKYSISVYMGTFLLFVIIVSVFSTSAIGKQRNKAAIYSDKSTKEIEKNVSIDNSKKDEMQDTDDDFSGEFDNVLSEIAAGIAEKGDYEVLNNLAPFVKKEDLDKIAKQIAEKGDYKAIIGLAPFLSKDAINAIARVMSEKEAYEDLVSLAPFMSETNLSFGNY